MPIVTPQSPTPPAVRILPLDRAAEFKDCDTAKDVQQKYFLDQLPFVQDGCFYYKNRGLRAGRGTVVLFQCDNSIIASAEFLRAERFGEPDAEGHKGGLYFDVDSIKIFDSVDAHGMKRIWPAFDGFSHVKQPLDPKRYPVFERKLRGLEVPRSHLRAEEADERESNDGEGYRPQEVDLRPLVEQQIRERRGQRKFRDSLRERYGDRCLVTGCEILAVLEAAHIKPYRGEPDNHPENGLLLRADIHTLFDLDLLGIEPDHLRVDVHPHLIKEYGVLAEKTLCCAGDKRPSRQALQVRYKLFTKRIDKPI